MKISIYGTYRAWDPLRYVRSASVARYYAMSAPSCEPTVFVEGPPSVRSTLRIYATADT